MGGLTAFGATGTSPSAGSPEQRVIGPESGCWPKCPDGRVDLLDGNVWMCSEKHISRISEESVSDEFSEHFEPNQRQTSHQQGTNTTTELQGGPRPRPSGKPVGLRREGPAGAVPSVPRTLLALSSQCPEGEERRSLSRTFAD